MEKKERPYDTSILHEPSAVYGLLDNPLGLIQRISNGISFHFFEKLKLQSPFSETDWAEYLGLSTKSLNRYKNENDFVFKPLQSEKLIQLSEVILLGNEVFDEKNQFDNWLKRPSIALGGFAPKELLKSAYGKELVMNELHRIDQGIFS